MGFFYTLGRFSFNAKDAKDAKSARVAKRKEFSANERTPAFIPGLKYTAVTKRNLKLAFFAVFAPFALKTMTRRLYITIESEYGLPLDPPPVCKIGNLLRLSALGDRSFRQRRDRHHRSPVIDIDRRCGSPFHGVNKVV